MVSIKNFLFLFYLCGTWCSKRSITANSSHTLAVRNNFNKFPYIWIPLLVLLLALFFFKKQPLKSSCFFLKRESLLKNRWGHHTLTQRQERCFHLRDPGVRHVATMIRYDACEDMRSPMWLFQTFNSVDFVSFHMKYKFHTRCIG